MLSSVDMSTGHHSGGNRQGISPGKKDQTYVKVMYVHVLHDNYFSKNKAALFRSKFYLNIYDILSSIKHSETKSIYSLIMPMLFNIKINILFSKFCNILMVS